MFIERNGKKIKLTSKEIEQAYRLREKQFREEDFFHYAEENDIDLTEENLDTCIDMFDKELSNIQSYWDGYWEAIRLTLEKATEE